MWQIYEAYIEFVNINNLSIFTRIANRIANSKDIKRNFKANIYVKRNKYLRKLYQPKIRNLKLHFKTWS